MSFRILKTIQNKNNLNEIVALDYHNYIIRGINGNKLEAKIQFQNGPRNVEGSTSGVLDHELLEIVRDRLKHFQEGEFACRENALALTHIEEALMWMNQRTVDRASRGVLGTYNK